MAFDPSSTPLDVYRLMVAPVTDEDARSTTYLKDAHTLGLSRIQKICCQDLFFIEGIFEEDQLHTLANRLLSDPLTQTVQWTRITCPGAGAATQDDGAHVIEVALRPGVTDPVAEQIVRAAEVLGLSADGRGVQRASTGLRFVVSGDDLDPDTLALLAGRLLANPTIQVWQLGAIEPAFPQAAVASPDVERIAVRGLSADELMALSTDRRAALDLAEMQAVQAYFTGEDREMTDIEFETIAQTWSEHCGHKTFKAQITLQDNAPEQTKIDNLLKTYLRAATEKINAPWVRSAFVDNAGIIDFDADWEVSFKVETHNHPSAIEPFGGANTGTGGVIRDVIGVSAKPIAATDVLCFGPADTPIEDLPAGVLHPRRIRSGVIAGVQDYGNKIGLPTVSGAVLYDPGFTANPLVFCGCVGLAPKNKHPRSTQTGDRVIVFGGRTGRDGLRGATFSSMTMDAQTGEVAGASVQIGAPVVEKGLIDVIIQARDEGLYTAITDCGAGGLSSAVGEMASELGADVDLIAVPLKYPGLAPWEIWLSEAQERMVASVPESALGRLREICETYEVEMTDIGSFTGSGRLVVRYAGEAILDLENHFLHEGIPQRRLAAILPQEAVENGPAAAVDDPEPAVERLAALLGHPNIASKAGVIRIYDHEVQGGTVIKPLTGAENDGPSDAVVLKPAGTPGTTALVLSTGINPEYGKRDPYRMALSVIDEAVRNAVAVGADPDRLAVLDNFCWGDPKNPHTLGALVACCQGCYEAALRYGTPFISGKDSLNNEYMGKDGRRHAIPPTLLISAIGVIPDLNRTVTMDLKQPGNRLYLAGDFRPSLAASHYGLARGLDLPGAVPGLPVNGQDVYRALYQSIQNGLVRACHDLSEGGLAVAAAEMCIGGRLGLEIRLEGSAGAGGRI
jgi:phosphoribosylformylglycinamidine synthase subunit PurSL